MPYFRDNLLLVFSGVGQDYSVLDVGTESGLENDSDFCIHWFANDGFGLVALNYCMRLRILCRVILYFPSVR